MTNTVQASEVAAVINKIAAAWTNAFTFRRVHWFIIEAPDVSVDTQQNRSARHGRRNPVVRPNDCVHLPGRLQRHGVAQDQNGGPVRYNALLCPSVRPVVGTSGELTRTQVQLKGEPAI